MLIIRLKPTGRTNRVSYRVVADEKRSKLNGKSVDDLGYWNPSENPPKLEIDRNRLAEWVKKGAQVSSAVTKLLSQPTMD